MLFLTPLIALSTFAGQDSSADLIALEQIRLQEYKKIQNIRDHIQEADPNATVVPNTLLTNPDIQAMGLDTPDGERQLGMALGYRFDKGVLSGYKPLDWNGSDPALNKTINRVDAQGKPRFESLKAGLSGVKLGVYQAEVTLTPLPSASVSVNTPPEIVQQYLGFLDRQDLENFMNYQQSHPQPNQKFKMDYHVVEDSVIPVDIYENSGGQLLAVLGKEPPLVFPDAELGVFSDTPAQAIEALKDGKVGDLKGGPIGWAVKEPEGIVDVEHVRRKEYVALQKLRDEVKLAHPTETSDFPPEMLQTPEFKATGLHMPENQSILFQALQYKPEGEVLKGYHPIDYSKDKASTEATVTSNDGKTLIVHSVKEAFQGKNCFIFKVTEQITSGEGAGKPRDFYFGPATQEQLDNALKLVPKTVTVTVMKDKKIPLDIFTNDQGDVAFVMASRPTDVLLIPEHPSVLIAKDSVDKLGQLDMKSVQSLEHVTVDYAMVAK